MVHPSSLGLMGVLFCGGGLWAAQQAGFRVKLPSVEQSVESVQKSNKSIFETITSVYEDTKELVDELKDRKELLYYDVDHGGFSYLCAKDAHERYLTVQDNATISVYDLFKGNKIYTTATQQYFQSHVCINHELLGMSMRDMIRIVRWGDGTVVKEIPWQAPLQHLMFDETGSYLIAQTNENRVAVWGMQSVNQEPMYTIPSTHEALFVGVCNNQLMIIRVLPRPQRRPFEPIDSMYTYEICTYDVVTGALQNTIETVENDREFSWLKLMTAFYVNEHNVASLNEHYRNKIITYAPQDPIQDEKLRTLHPFLNQLKQTFSHPQKVILAIDPGGYFNLVRISISPQGLQDALRATPAHLLRVLQELCLLRQEIEAMEQAQDPRLQGHINLPIILDAEDMAYVDRLPSILPAVVRARLNVVGMPAPVANNPVVNNQEVLEKEQKAEQDPVAAQSVQQEAQRVQADQERTARVEHEAQEAQQRLKRTQENLAAVRVGADQGRQQRDQAEIARQAQDRREIRHGIMALALVGAAYYLYKRGALIPSLMGWFKRRWGMARA